MDTIQFKRGDTFTVRGEVPAEFLGNKTWTVRSHLRPRDREEFFPLEATLDTSASPAMLTLHAAATQTALWPITRLTGDIEFSTTDPEPFVVSSNDFFVHVVEDFTI